MDPFRYDTFQASSFMPPLKDTRFYFGHSWRPPEKDLYYPKKNDFYYQVSSLGQITPASEFKNTFKDLATIGVGLYVGEQQRKDNEKQRQYELEIEKIKTDALIAVAREQSKVPTVINNSNRSSSGLYALGGIAFVGVVGGVMYFLTKK